MGASASHSAIQHHSLHSRVPTRARFENCTQHAVRVEWLDYAGQPRTYVILQPGESYQQDSFCSHPWQFAAEDGACELVHNNAQVVYLEPEADYIRITEAAAVPWSTETHARFPAHFKEQVQAVLLCHHLCGRSQQHGSRLGHSCSQPVLPACTACSCLLSAPFIASTLSKLRCSDPGARQPAGQDQQLGIQDESHDPPCTLASLPKDVLMEVVRLAAPRVPHVIKPRFPPAVNEADYSQEERIALFSS